MIFKCFDVACMQNLIRNVRFHHEEELSHEENVKGERSFLGAYTELLNFVLTRM